MDETRQFDYLNATTLTRLSSALFICYDFTKISCRILPKALLRLLL